MVLTEEQLMERDAKRNIGDELLQSIRDVKAGRIGAAYMVETTLRPRREPEPGFQLKFAQLLGVSVRTLQEWEQGRRTPSGAARSLLNIAAARPDVFRDVLAE